MARGTATSASQLKMKVSKAELAARKQMETEVVYNTTKPKQNEITKSSPSLKKFFKEILKWNDHFTESDSVAINTLAYNLYLKYSNQRQLLSLAIDSRD